MRCWIAALLLAGLVQASAAQPVRELGPGEAVRLGLERNPRVHVAREQAAEAVAAFRETRSYQLPALRGEGAYQRLSPNLPDFEVTLPPGFPDLGEAWTIAPAILDRYDFRLRLEQPVFAGFRLRNQTAAARLLAEAQDEAAAAAEADLALEVLQAYWALYEARAVAAVVDEALAQVEVRLRDVENLRERGMALEGDVLALRTRRAEVELERLDAHNAARLAELGLNALVGLPLETALRLAAEPEAPPPPKADLDALVAEALRQRAGLAAVRREVEAREAMVRAARGAAFPSIALVGLYQYARPNLQVFPLEDEFTGTWEAGVTVSVDLWNWGRTRAQTQQARARARQAVARLADLETAVRVDVARRLLEVQRAEAAVRVAEVAVREAAEANRLAGERLRQGAMLTAEALDVEVAYRSAETRRVRARAAYAVARAALDRALGRPPER